MGWDYPISGGVTGPGAGVAGRAAILDATGNVLSRSAGAPISEILTTNGDLVIRAAGVATRLPIGAAGTTLLSSGTAPFWGASAVGTVTTEGDIIYRNASTLARLGIGIAGQVLTVNAGATAPEWQTPAAGGGETSWTAMWALPQGASGVQILDPIAPPQPGYTNVLGWALPLGLTIVDIGMLFGSSSASTSSSYTVQIRSEAAGAGSQHVLGGGTLETSITFASGGALGSAFYRNTSSTGLSVAVAAGRSLFAEISAVGTWTVNDLVVWMRLKPT